MNFEEIKQALKANECSIAIIARHIKKSHTAVTAVARGEITSKPIAIAIAKGMSVTIEEAFPNKPYYHEKNRFKNKQEQEQFWQEQLAS